MTRPLTELEMRATVALVHISLELRNKCIEIARTKSPSSAFDLASQACRLASLDQMQTLGVAKATRWLAVIRRDYGLKAFEEVVRTLPT